MLYLFPKNHRDCFIFVVSTKSGNIGALFQLTPKLGKYMDVNWCLNTFSFLLQGRKYELVATITHHGRDPSKGHYTTDARHHSGHWLRFDDSAVNVVSTSKVLHEHPYVLFYKQV